MAERNIIHTTLTGSQAWDMATQDSDKDYWYTYVADTKQFLQGTARLKSTSHTHKGGDEDDSNWHEAGSTVEQLIKGNCNFIMAATSPQVEQTTPLGLELKQLVHSQPISGISKSVLGTARQNMARNCTPALQRSKSFEEVITHWQKYGPTNKREIQKIARYVDFGITALEYERYEFTKPSDTYTSIQQLVDDVQHLRQLETESTLPETMDEEPLREWLYRARLAFLNYNQL